MIHRKALNQLLKKTCKILYSVLQCDLHFKERERNIHDNHELHEREEECMFLTNICSNTIFAILFIVRHNHRKNKIHYDELEKNVGFYFKAIAFLINQVLCECFFFFM
jgi:hypothetical protein